MKNEKFKKKPVVIEAIQLKVDNFDSVCDFMGGTPVPKHNPNYGVDEHGNTNEPYLGMYIETLEGKMLANYGDYIIKDVNGEFYPCKPDIFEKTYLKAPETFFDRLVVERDELAEKLEKLETFLKSSRFEEIVSDKHQRMLLLSQREHMNMYLTVLQQRISSL